MVSEKRKNPLLKGETVIISPERLDRPFAFIKSRSSLSPENCPFCPGHENETTSETLAYRRYGSNKNDPNWWVRFVENKYPAVSLNRNGFYSEGLFEKSDAIGLHEVCVTREHGVDFGEPGFDDNLTYELLWAIHERKLKLIEENPELVFAEFFKNRGEEAGGSLDHPHIQLLAIDDIPLRNKLEYFTSFEYSLRNNACLLCEMTNQERKKGDRIIDENSNYVVIMPYASRYPYETLIIPLKHTKSYSITREKALSLASILRKTFERLNTHLNNPDYNFSIQDSPIRNNNHSLDGDDKTYHWYIELSPRLTKMGGWERGTWWYINPLPPEWAAEKLNKITAA